MREVVERQQNEGPAPVRHVDATQYDGVAADELARWMHVPAVAVYEELGSTMDVAHELAGAGVPAGTVVLADRQTAGRGRSGRRWISPGGSGIWLTVIERPADGSGMDVLALRLGLRAAAVLDRHADAQIGLKWPNDLYCAGRKVGGVLTEARWQEGRPLWVAIGIGINVREGAVSLPTAGALSRGTTRLAVLRDLVPAARDAAAAAAAAGPLTPSELDAFARRDVARGRVCRQPGVGRVEGIAPTGELLLSHGGMTQAYRSGSLVLGDDQDEP